MLAARPAAVPSNTPARGRRTQSISADAAAGPPAANDVAPANAGLPPARPAGVPQAAAVAVPTQAAVSPRERSLFPARDSSDGFSDTTTALSRAAAALSSLQRPQPSAVLGPRPAAPAAATVASAAVPAQPFPLSAPPPRVGAATLEQRPSFHAARAAMIEKSKRPTPPPVFSDVDPFVDRYSAVPMTVTGDKTPQPLLSFNELAASPYAWPTNLLKNMADSKLHKPTPVQSHAIPAMFGGRDLLVCAQSGSGKTVAFLAPMIARLMREERLRTKNTAYPSALVLTPTRELAAQLYSVARSLVKHTHVRVVCLHGGAMMAKQIMFLRGGCDIMIATPGRLIEILDVRKRVRLSQLQYLVVDEADRMLDLGFETELQRIARHKSIVPCGQRQTAFFSATFPTSLQQVSNEYLHHPLTVRMGLEGGSSALITQRVIAMPPTLQHRLTALEGHVKEVPGLCIVFCSSGQRATAVHAHLTARGTAASLMHSGLHQELRDEAMKCFEFGVTTVLVATDIISRGLNVLDVGHIVQFDMPAEIEDYVNRIGRTGRAGRLGVATSYFTVHDTPLSAALQQVLVKSSQPVPAWLATMAQQMVEPSIMRLSKAGASDKISTAGAAGAGKIDPPSPGELDSRAGFRSTPRSQSWPRHDDAQPGSSLSNNAQVVKQLTSPGLKGKQPPLDEVEVVKQLTAPWTRGKMLSRFGSFQPSDEPLLAVLREQRHSGSSSSSDDGGATTVLRELLAGSGSSSSGTTATTTVALRPADSSDTSATPPSPPLSYMRNEDAANPGPRVSRKHSQRQQRMVPHRQKQLRTKRPAAPRRPVANRKPLAELWADIIDENGLGARIDEVIASARAATAEALVMAEASRASAVAQLAEVRREAWRQAGQQSSSQHHSMGGHSSERTSRDRNAFDRTASAAGRYQGSGGMGPASFRWRDDGDRFDAEAQKVAQQSALRDGYARLNTANQLARYISRVGRLSDTAVTATMADFSGSVSSGRRPSGIGGGGRRDSSGPGAGSSNGDAADNRAARPPGVNIQTLAAFASHSGAVEPFTAQAAGAMGAASPHAEAGQASVVDGGGPAV